MLLHLGEVEALGWHVQKLSEVMGTLRRASPGVTGRPRLIGVDGRGGAGKTALVEHLRRLVPASGVVHTDDVAWHDARFEWGALMRLNILEPLHRGEKVDFRPPAWVERDRPGAIQVPAALDFVWIEGTGIIRQELTDWIDASIWIQGDIREQERRLLRRDGDSAAQRQDVARWLEEELPFMLREKPWAHATMLLAGDRLPINDPGTHAVVAPPVKSGKGGRGTDPAHIGPVS